MKNVIYKIANTVNDRIYIGSTEKFNIRKNQHNHHLKKGTHHSRILQSHVNKYGFKSIYFEVLEFEVGNLIEREQFYIDTLNPYFNIRKIAENMKGTKRTEEQKIYMVQQRQIKNPYKKGWKHSEESVKKMIDTRLKNGGYVVTNETKQKISKANKGRVVSKETKIKISNSNKGKLTTSETKLKLSEQKKGESNPMFGKSKERHHNFGKNWICKKNRTTKKVIDTSTGALFNSVKDASIFLDIPQSTLNKYILGYNKKITNFKYYE